MTESDSELLSRLVTGRHRDGRCRYDAQAKLELVRECLKPGVSVAATALRHGVNANLLRKWISKSLGQSAVGTQAAAAMNALAAPNPFVQVQLDPGASRATARVRVGVGHCQNGMRSEPSLRRLQVHLPNGVWVDLGDAGLQELSPVMQMLSNLPCSN